MQCAIFLSKEIDKADYKEYKHYNGKNVGYVGTHPLLDLKSLTLVCFIGKLLPSPAVSAYAEQNKDKRAERKHNVTYDKVLPRHYILSERSEAR